jgi:hypothetical protein
MCKVGNWMLFLVELVVHWDIAHFFVVHGEKR